MLLYISYVTSTWMYLLKFIENFYDILKPASFSDSIKLKNDKSAKKEREMRGGNNGTGKVRESFRLYGY